MVEVGEIVGERRGLPPPSYARGPVPPVLERRHKAGGSPGETSSPGLAKLREVTGQVVGSVFYGTLLKTMRSSALKGKYGHGGYGETVFQGQLDQVLAERAGASRRSGLTAFLVDRLGPQQLRIEAARAEAPNSTEART